MYIKPTKTMAKFIKQKDMNQDIFSNSHLG